MLTTLSIFAVLAAVFYVFREPIRRNRAKHLSPGARHVQAQLALPGWELRTIYLWREESKLQLKIGYGFWHFDIVDKDYIRELTLSDRFVLWPEVKKLRHHLKWVDPKPETKDGTELV